MVKLVMISGPFQAIYSLVPRGTQSQIVRAERIIISYSTEIYRRYQHYKYIFGCGARQKHERTIGTLMEIENCQIHGQVSQNSLH